jgi:hypothetical protein
MKLVKEYIINEKFTSDSDLVEDMGIGSIALLKDFIQNMLDIDLANEYGNIYRKGVTTYINTIMYINIKYGRFTVQFYSNPIFDKKQKRIFKKPYVIELLKESNLYKYLDIEKVSDDPSLSSNETYHFYFPIKEQYRQRFGKITGEYQSLYEKNGRRIPT